MDPERTVTIVSMLVQSWMAEMMVRNTDDSTSRHDIEVLLLLLLLVVEVEVVDVEVVEVDVIKGRLEQTRILTLMMMVPVVAR
jgi:hypothetical protein